MQCRLIYSRQLLLPTTEKRDKRTSKRIKLQVCNSMHAITNGPISWTAKSLGVLKELSTDHFGIIKRAKHSEGDHWKTGKVPLSGNRRTHIHFPSLFL